MNEQMEKVWDVLVKSDLWQTEYIHEGVDRYENHYILVEDGKVYDKVVSLAVEVLGLEEDASDTDVERELETTLVYTDEYTTCDDCGKIVRTAPDSYGWQPDFYVGDGFIACGECFDAITDYQEAYLEERINNPKNAVNGMLSDTQLENLGFEKLEGGYESGWHPGQTDDPTEIFDIISDRYEEVLFTIDEVSQFYIRFGVWVRGEIE